jgi:hypothetical protein
VAFSKERMPSQGALKCIVQRHSDGARSAPLDAVLSPEDGLVGDRWSSNPKKKVVEQIAIMDWQIACLIANGQSLTLFGDNLFVDWDFSDVEIGKHFSLGEAVLTITPESHVGCSKFAMRFGSAALKYTCIQSQNNVRGVYACVVRAGRIAIGDRIVFL